jgi:hypothetical protein
MTPPPFSRRPAGHRARVVGRRARCVARPGRALVGPVPTARPGPARWDLWRLATAVVLLLAAGIVAGVALVSCSVPGSHPARPRPPVVCPTPTPTPVPAPTPAPVATVFPVGEVHPTGGLPEGEATAAAGLGARVGCVGAGDG